MNILGLSWGHDSTAAVCRDGRLVAAVAEERISRHKNHTGFPYAAIADVIRLAGLTPGQVDEVAIGFTGAHPAYFNGLFFHSAKQYDLSNKVPLAVCLGYLGDQFRRVTRKGGRQAFDRQYQAEALGQALSGLGIKAPIKAYDHHQCHAASALYTSGWEKAAAFVVDQYGDDKCASVWNADGKLELLAHYGDVMSPGAFYTEITHFLGYKRHRHEGKISGLAAHGDATKFYAVLKPCLRFIPGDPLFSDIRPRSEAAYALKKAYRMLFSGEVIQGNLNAYREHFERYLRGAKAEDVAAGAQLVLEEFVRDFVRHHRPKNKSRLLLAGGTFANVRVNQVVRELEGVDSVYIHPDMGDGGLAAGAALLASADNGAAFPPRIKDVYLGGQWDDAEIERTLKAREFDHQRVDDIEAAIAKHLKDGLIVGRFNGRMEYGPRALGNRSILAEAVDAGINDNLNKRLHRTEFMPFAPLVLRERAHEVLVDFRDDDMASEFMTTTYFVKKEYWNRIAAVVHLDKTARPQIVDESRNPSLYRVMKEYEKLSGIPVLVNTSFNSHEEPIVYTPEHALNSLSQGAIDVLAIGNWMVYPKK